MKEAINQPNALPSWEDEKRDVCRRLTASAAPLKIVLKTKDDAAFLGGWIEHHRRIVGLENLVIFDNGSTDPEVYEIYEALGDEPVIASFRGHHNHINRPARFPELYDALRGSARYFTMLDTDERIVWAEGPQEYKQDASILERIQGSGAPAYPGLWLTNVNGCLDRFHLFDAGGRGPMGAGGGKLIISARAPLSELVCHNSQADPAVFEGLDRAHLLVLHMKNLSARQRIRTNIRKLRQYNVIGPRDGVDAVLALEPGHLRSQNPRQWVAEVRGLVERDETAPSDRRHLAKGQIELREDGTIRFFDAEDRDRFAAFQREPFPVFARAIGLSTAARNPSFRGWATDSVPIRRNDIELCDAWLAELSPRPRLDSDQDISVVARPANPKTGSGLRLEVSREHKRVRIYQPWTPPPLGSPRLLEVALAFATQGSLRLEWVAILRVEADGDRVLARRVEEGRLETAGLTDDERYLLAIEFAGGPGEIRLDRCSVFPAPKSEKLSSQPPTRPHRRPAGRVTVVGWDLAHNPAGRSFLLADLASWTHAAELVGPVFAAYGGRVWPPLAGQSEIPIRAFPADNLRSFATGARELAERVECDLVYVSKARLPSLLLGALIKRQNGCPLVVDVDDRERSFFSDVPTPSLADLEAAATDDPGAVEQPYSALWTAFTETLIAQADAVTVSNVALQQRFGGTIIRHARNERIFDPSRYDRISIRREFGYGPDDRVVLFLGTPRPHKGIFEIADAMEWLDIPNLALCVIGSANDERVSSRFSSYVRARIDRHPDQPWGRLPELVAMADAVILPQDPRSPISAHQIPAKLTDALAMGVPVYATPTPPLRDLIEQGVVRAIPDAAALGEALRDIAEAPERPADPDRTRYLAEFSYRVNADRLRTVLTEASQTKPKPLGPIDEVLAVVERQAGIAFPVEPPKRDAGRPRPGLRRTAPVDAVFLWRRNDSDLYGRRPDMLVKHLVSTGKVRRVLHFDAPVTTKRLEGYLADSNASPAHQGKHVFINTLRRILKVADEPDFVRRTFLYDTDSASEGFLGMPVPGRNAYAEFIEESMRDAGIGSNCLLIVSPPVSSYETVRDVVGPRAVVADLVDDQRKWPSITAEQAQTFSDEYAQVLLDADVVTCNCAPVREGFAYLRDDINVVPNGLELYPDADNWQIPRELDELPRPILGYVGNLRDRVDLDLIRKVAREYPDGSVALIGTTHGTPHGDVLAAEPNIYLLGVKPYAEAVRYTKHFDVGLLPHTANELTRNMNPLKAYVYASLGVPIVATSVGNLDDVAPFTLVASDHDSFVQHVSRVLAGDFPSLGDDERSDILRGLTWDARVEAMWQLVPLAQTTAVSAPS